MAFQAYRLLSSSERWYLKAARQIEFMLFRSQKDNNQLHGAPEIRLPYFPRVLRTNHRDINKGKLIR